MAPPRSSKILPSISDYSSSTMSSPSPVSAQVYLKELKRKRAIINTLSESGSDDVDHGLENERVQRLRQRTESILASCSFNSSDPQWGKLRRLLRLSSTLCGTKYIVKSPGTLALPPPGGWPDKLPETEEEWKKNGTDIIEKVAGWVHSVEIEPIQPKKKPGPSPKKKKVATASCYDTKDPSPLGFLVSKRVAAVGKGFEAPKPADGSPSLSTPAKPVPTPKPVDDLDDSPIQVIKSKSQSQLKPHPSITSVPEDTFFPPSFPSELETSTPPINIRHKPDVITARVEASPDSSPIMVQIEGKGKRPRSPSPGPSNAKKARIDSPVGRMTDLRELLESARTPSPKKRTSKSTSVVTPTKPPSEACSSLKLAVAKPPSRVLSKTNITREKSEPLYLDIDIASPAKSLSYIAGDDSDNESEVSVHRMSDDEGPSKSQLDAFGLGDNSGADDFAGTQLQGAYNSQFDLEGGLDDLQGFLDKDISMAGDDYEGGAQPVEDSQETFSKYFNIPKSRSGSAATGSWVGRR